MSEGVAEHVSAFTTVLICKNPLLRAGLQYLLMGSCFVVFDPVSDEISLSRYRSEIQPALFIIDANTSLEQMIEIITLLKVQQPEARIVVVADQFHISFIQLGIDAGIDGFCLASSNRDVLIKSLELVMMGEKVVPGTLARAMLNEMVLNAESDQDSPVAEPLRSDPGKHNLSPREAEILRCLMRGDPNKVIARNLNVAEATIKVHLKAILRKIGVANRTQAAMWAQEHLRRRVGKP
jgi:two-component system, NarL family, nitrate/nitrite response regulator NarL